MIPARPAAPHVDSTVDETGYQQALAVALLSGAGTEDHHPPVIRQLALQPAFTVYRNTVLRGCVEALEANFPCIARLVGLAWFHGAALQFAAGQPPTDGRLMYYGAGFPAFLAGLPSTADLPYLEGVACLEQLHREALGAADAPPRDPSRLARLDANTLGRQVLHLHPATRWRWCPVAPAFAIWQRERAQVEGLSPRQGPDDIDWHPDGALITRPEGAIRWQALNAPGCAFVDACAAGLPLAHAAEAALATDSDTDLAGLMQQLLAAGAFREEEIP